MPAVGEVNVNDSATRSANFENSRSCETYDWPATVLGDDVRTYHYYVWMHEGTSTENPTRPINGEPSPLVIDRPCEELDLPRSPP